MAGETKKWNEKEFFQKVFARARTLGKDKSVTSQVDPTKLMLTEHYVDVDGGKWELGKPSPYSEGKNNIIAIFLDDGDETRKPVLRAYCVPGVEHPGKLTRYVMPRTKEPGAKFTELRVDKTLNEDLFAAFIAYELRALDSETPPVAVEDELAELED